MSDILIRGIEMPDCCYKCFALDDSADCSVCLITREQRGYSFPVREMRMDKCPLVALQDVSISKNPTKQQVLICPRCGKDVEIKQSTNWDTLDTSYYPKCRHCGFTTMQLYDTKELLLSDWKNVYNKERK